MTGERCVLAIDDSALVRHVVQRMLERRGWKVLTADNGDAGVALAVSERPDAILLDVVMPDPDGPETLGRLRADERTAGIPVFFLTASADDPRESERLSALGADGVLSKSFDPENLAGLLAGLLPPA